MQQDSAKNFFDLIQKSQTVLVALPKQVANQPGKDAIGAGVALAEFLRKLDKEVEVVCEGAPLDTVSYIPGADGIRGQISVADAFVISVDTSSTKLDELSYRTLEDRVDIHLKPTAGSFTAENISFTTQRASYDLIVCVEAPSLERLGAVYANNATLFFDSPKVNIDNHIANENYGTLNIVDVTAAATSEIIFELLKEFESSLIDPNIATALLAGIIGETNSFQRPSTTHHSFQRASELISFGADQQEIVKHLFKTRTFSMLKLWGRAMARVKPLAMPAEDTSLLYAVVTAQDIERSGANSGDIEHAFYELLANLPEIKALFFVAETADALTLYFFIHPNLRFIDVANEFAAEPISESTARAALRMPLADAEGFIASALSGLKSRIGL